MTAIYGSHVTHKASIRIGEGCVKNEQNRPSFKEIMAAEMKNLDTAQHAKC